MSPKSSKKQPQTKRQKKPTASHGSPVLSEALSNKCRCGRCISWKPINPKDPKGCQIEGTCESWWVYTAMNKAYPIPRTKTPIAIHRMITWFGYGCIACETTAPEKQQPTPEPMNFTRLADEIITCYVLTPNRLDARKHIAEKIEDWYMTSSNPQKKS